MRKINKNTKITFGYRVLPKAKGKATSVYLKSYEESPYKGKNKNAYYNIVKAPCRYY